MSGPSSLTCFAVRQLKFRTNQGSGTCSLRHIVVPHRCSASLGNFSDTVKADPRSDCSHFLGAPIAEAGSNCIPRVHVSTLRPGDLVKNVLTPVVLTGLAESWPAKHFWSLDYLSRVHGDVKVADLTLPDELFINDEVGASVGNALYADHLRNAYVPFVRTPLSVSLREYVESRFQDYIFEISEFGIAGRLSVDAFGGLDALPALLAADDLSQLTVGLGPAGDGVMLHAHTAAWNALMMGEKEWYFFKPNGLTGTTYSRLAMLESRMLPEAIHHVVCEQERELGSPESRVFNCRQRAGEVVYVPDGWWHATFSHTVTACLGGQRHKNRLPGDWAERLLERWPGCGLAIIVEAKKHRDDAMFEDAICLEPFNLRFVVDFIMHLQTSGKYAYAARVASRFRDTVKSLRQRCLLSRCELAAILAQLAEKLYHVVEYAANRVYIGSGAPFSQAVFVEMVEVSQTARQLAEEALTLDRGAPLALEVLAAIELKANFQLQALTGSRKMGKYLTL